MRKAKQLPPYVKATPAGGLRLDTKHPEWVKFFTHFILKNAGRIKIKPHAANN